jgi:hypothetical protein
MQILTHGMRRGKGPGRCGVQGRLLDEEKGEPG